MNLRPRIVESATIASALADSARGQFAMLGVRTTPRQTRVVYFDEAPGDPPCGVAKDGISQIELRDEPATRSKRTYLPRRVYRASLPRGGD